MAKTPSKKSAKAAVKAPAKARVRKGETKEPKQGLKFKNTLCRKLFTCRGYGKNAFSRKQESIEDYAKTLESMLYAADQRLDLAKFKPIGPFAIQLIGILTGAIKVKSIYGHKTYIPPDHCLRRVSAGAISIPAGAILSIDSQVGDPELQVVLDVYDAAKDCIKTYGHKLLKEMGCYAKAGDPRTLECASRLDMLLVLNSVVGPDVPKFWMGQGLSRVPAQFHFRNLSKQWVRAREVTEGNIDGLLDWYIANRGRAPRGGNWPKGSKLSSTAEYKKARKAYDTKMRAFFGGGFVASSAFGAKKPPFRVPGSY